MLLIIIHTCNNLQFHTSWEMNLMQIDRVLSFRRLDYAMQCNAMIFTLRI